jgi:hypothetical protein
MDCTPEEARGLRIANALRDMGLFAEAEEMWLDVHAQRDARYVAEAHDVALVVNDALDARNIKRSRVDYISDHFDALREDYRWEFDKAQRDAINSDHIDALDENYRRDADTARAAARALRTRAWEEANTEERKRHESITARWDENRRRRADILAETQARVESEGPFEEGRAAREYAETQINPGPRFPEGTPEYEAYARLLRIELAKWKSQAPPYTPFDHDLL